MKLELKTLSFKTLFPDYNIHEQELEYGGILGWGEVSNFFPYKFVCFRKGNKGYMGYIERKKAGYDLHRRRNTNIPYARRAFLFIIHD